MQNSLNDISKQEMFNEDELFKNIQGDDSLQVNIKTPFLVSMSNIYNVSMTRWIQTYYDDLTFMFETHLCLYFVSEFHEFVYNNSDKYVSQSTSYEYQHCDSVNDLEYVEELSSTERKNLYDIWMCIKQYTNENCPNVLSKCTFEIFETWIKGLWDLLNITISTNSKVEIACKIKH